jgi:hypothetical protein
VPARNSGTKRSSGTTFRNKMKSGTTSGNKKKFRYESQKQKKYRYDIPIKVPARNSGRKELQV